MSRVFNISGSGFYAWRKRQSQPSARQQHRRKLDEVVKEAFRIGKGRSGSPRLVLDLLEQDFTATAPNQQYAGDITYLWTDEGWLYLAVIIDLYSRSVVGWSMSERMTAQWVCDALKMAMWRRHMPTDVIVHSDRGSQYCSGAYQKLLKEHGLIGSMSAKGR